MNVAQQEARLIALVDEYSTAECGKLIENAEKKSSQILADEYQNARVQVHQAVEQERARAMSLIRSAEAELHSWQRAHKQRITQALLKEGWAYLQTLLKQKWQQADTRRLWIQRCAREALIRLPATDSWQVQHPANTRAQELLMFKNVIAKKLAHTRVEHNEKSEIEAGLLICSNNTCLDMSLPGLLHDRSSIEGRMLALMHEAVAP